MSKRDELAAAQCKVEEAEDRYRTLHNAKQPELRSRAYRELEAARDEYARLDFFWNDHAMKGQRPMFIGRFHFHDKPGRWQPLKRKPITRFENSTDHQEALRKLNAANAAFWRRKEQDEHH